MWWSSAVSPFILLSLAISFILTVRVATRVACPGIASNYFLPIIAVPDASLISSTIIGNLSLIMPHGPGLLLQDVLSSVPLTSTKTPQVVMFANCATEIAWLVLVQVILNAKLVLRIHINLILLHATTNQQKHTAGIHVLMGIMEFKIRWDASYVLQVRQSAA